MFYERMDDERGRCGGAIVLARNIACIKYTPREDLRK
jgi:hypothetical protein